MKHVLIASVTAIALSTGSALAADMGMPLKAPPAPAPAVSWTGCYLDGGAGYGFWDQRHNLNDAGFALSETTDSAGQGWLGRLGAGCDYQISRFVVGAFGDYDFADLHGTIADGTLAGEEKESSAWAVGGRIGYLVTPSLLTYFDGGYTQARFSGINFNFNEAPFSATGDFVASHTYHGWFIGGGTEYALSGIVPISGLFWRTEYRFAQYQAADLPIDCSSAALCGAVGPTGVTLHSRQDVQTITSGIVWRFNFGG